MSIEIADGRFVLIYDVPSHSWALNEYMPKVKKSGEKYTYINRTWHSRIEYALYEIIDRIPKDCKDIKEVLAKLDEIKTEILTAIKKEEHKNVRTKK